MCSTRAPGAVAVAPSMVRAAPARVPTGPGPVVVHLGDSPESDLGGISRVVRTHLSRDLGALRLVGLPSYDPRASTQVGRQAPAVVALVRLIRTGWVRRRPAVLHVHVSNGLSPVREGGLALLGRLLGWRVCATWHSSSALARRTAAGRLALWAAFAPAHVVHVLSDAHAAVAPVRAGRLVVIPNDVPAPATVPSMDARRPAVVFAGEVGSRKGADVLLAAWRDLDRQVAAGWTLHVFGRVTAPMREAVDQVDDSVEVHGVTPGAVVRETLLSSAVAVLPSRAEALPMFVLEAMAAGTAVVASDVGAVASVLGDSAGVLVEAGSRPALVTALTEVMTSPELRERLAGAALARVRSTYAEPVVTARWAELYRRLLR
ncbi:glycosyltransferase family 4 protein [Blastococcus sp. SYSU D00695]